jgi:hypothetical protein
MCQQRYVIEVVSRENPISFAAASQSLFSLFLSSIIGLSLQFWHRNHLLREVVVKIAVAWRFPFLRSRRLSVLGAIEMLKGLTKKTNRCPYCAFVRLLKVH